MPNSELPQDCPNRLAPDRCDNDGPFHNPSRIGTECYCRDAQAASEAGPPNANSAGEAGGAKAQLRAKPSLMPLIVVESPYAGQVARNTSYAQACCLDCLRRGESPIASHLLYPQFLDERVPEERQLGIRAGLAWARLPGVRMAFYTDLGWSDGMLSALNHAQLLDIPYEIRFIPHYRGAFP